MISCSVFGYSDGNNERRRHCTKDVVFFVLRTQEVALLPIEYGAPIGDARMLTGVYIDDLIVAHICKKSVGTYQEWILRH